MTWCFFSVIVITKAPCETPYQGLCCYHGDKRPKHHCVCHHSWQLVWWCWYCLIKFDFQVKGLLDYRVTLRHLQVSMEPWAEQPVLMSPRWRSFGKQILSVQEPCMTHVSQATMASCGRVWCFPDKKEKSHNYTEIQSLKSVNQKIKGYAMFLF